MNFNISAFTHIGSQRKINQDRILVLDKISEKDFHHLENQATCFCFVADGIGGGVAGEFASQFILEKILLLKELICQLDEKIIQQKLHEINNELINYTSTKPEYFGTGSTLTGLVITETDEFLVINAGDSEIWVLRNQLFFQITEAQVLDESEKGSPLLSYFGGKKASLEIAIASTLREIQKEDLFVIASDGLLNAIPSKQLKAILSNNQTLKQKSAFVLERVLANMADDNVSCILIEIMG